MSMDMIMSDASELRATGFVETQQGVQQTLAIFAVVVGMSRDAQSSAANADNDVLFQKVLSSPLVEWFVLAFGSFHANSNDAAAPGHRFWPFDDEAL